MHFILGEFNIYVDNVVNIFFTFIRFVRYY